MNENENKILNPTKSSSSGADVNSLALRTMEKDIKNIGNPNFNAEDFLDEGKESAESNRDFNASLNEKQISSPFLNNSQTAVDSQNDIAKINIDTGKKLEPKIEKTPLPQNSHSDFNLGKIAFFGAVVFLILAGAATGYYYIINREKGIDTSAILVPQESIAPVETPIDETAVPTEEETPVQEEFNLDKPNFLVIETLAGEKVKTQQVIKDTLQKMQSLKNYGLLEFVPSDKNFTALTFQDFSQKLGITLPAPIMNALKPGFSIYASITENNETSLAFIVEIKDEKQLSTLMVKEEMKLTKEIEPLFLGKTYQDNGKAFLINLYKSISIKYHNLSPDGSLAVDWAILKGKLLIATSKSITLGLVDEL